MFSLTGFGDLMTISGFDPAVGPSVNVWQAVQSVLSPAGEDYAYYDFTDTSRLFVENTGPTPADTIDSNIGLVVSKQSDKRLSDVIDAMPELVVNGGFDSTNGWSMTSTSTISGGKLHMNNETAGNNVLQTGNGFVVGKMYRITYEISNYIGGQIRLQLESAVGATRTSNGNFTDYLVVTNANARIFVRAVSGVTCDVDNISIKEVPAHYGTQTSNTAKPTYQGSAGARFDGIDDVFSTDWLPNSVTNTIIAQIYVPTTLSSTKIISGSNLANDEKAIRLSISSAGNLRGAVSGITTLTDGTTDLRGKNVIVALTTGLNRTSIYSDNTIEATTNATNPGNTANGLAFRLGARNQANVTDLPYTGNIKRVAYGRRIITFTEFQTIRNAWLS